MDIAIKPGTIFRATPTNRLFKTLGLSAGRFFSPDGSPTRTFYLITKGQEYIRCLVGGGQVTETELEGLDLAMREANLPRDWADLRARVSQYQPIEGADLIEAQFAPCPCGMSHVHGLIILDGVRINIGDEIDTAIRSFEGGFQMVAALVHRDGSDDHVQHCAQIAKCLAEVEGLANTTQEALELERQWNIEQLYIENHPRADDMADVIAKSELQFDEDGGILFGAPEGTSDEMMDLLAGGNGDGNVWRAQQCEEELESLGGIMGERGDLLSQLLGARTGMPGTRTRGPRVMAVIDLRGSGLSSSMGDTSFDQFIGALTEMMAEIGMVPGRPPRRPWRG